MADIPKGAYKISLKAGKKYKICTCGTSQMLPYCDDSHRQLNEEKGTSYKSLKIFPEKDTIIYVFSNNWKK
ncbi:CDGSH iron-sulfur domain-containing protein [Candidatus Woesearchaeota archaeon]|jgi:CDGSH-type Zn-finger protein|nr:CDGSH iron-sulfur domain-containing protein [Candidatus Woesearchaeota archaeon]